MRPPLLPTASRGFLACLAAAVALAACGDDLGVAGIPLDADPLHFSNQRFFCPPAKPSCPPWVCSVDESGQVYDCDDSRCADDNSTVFESPFGYALCVPDHCTVAAEGVPPDCSERCSDDQTTRYEFLFACR